MYEGIISFNFVCLHIFYTAAAFGPQTPFFCARSFLVEPDCVNLISGKGIALSLRVKWGKKYKIPRSDKTTWRKIERLQTSVRQLETPWMLLLGVQLRSHLPLLS